MFSNTVAVVFAAFLAQSAFAADCTRKYTVKEGDICDSISAANQVSTYQLAVMNQGHIDSTCSNLIPGDEICLGNTGEDCTATYTVKSGDTCDGINSASGLNSTILYLNNPQINEACDNIYIGEVLCVGQTVQVPVAPSGGIPATTIPATATPAVPSASNTPAVVVSSLAAPPAASSPAVPETTEAPVVVSSSAVPAPTKSTPAPHNLAPAPTPAPEPSPAPAKDANVGGDDGDDDEDDDEDCDDSDDEDGSADNADDNGDDDDDDDDADDSDLPFCDEMDDN